MRIRLYFAIVVLLSLCFCLYACKSCVEESEGQTAPKSLAKMSLEGAATYGTGSFANMQGYRFTTKFEDQRRFSSVTSSGSVESNGTYTYNVTGNETAVLTLIDNSSLHTKEKLEVVLRFTSPNAGSYDAKSLSGQQGEQNGTFELR